MSSFKVEDKVKTPLGCGTVIEVKKDGCVVEYLPYYETLPLVKFFYFGDVQHNDRQDIEDRVNRQIHSFLE